MLLRNKIQKWALDLDWRLLILTLIPFSLFIFFSLTYLYNPCSPVRALLRNQPRPPNPAGINASGITAGLQVPPDPGLPRQSESDVEAKRKKELDRSRIAICLVGGARRFELTGPSLIENVIKVYRNSDLFLHSPMDADSFKFSLLKNAPRIAAIRVFVPQPIPETPEQARVLTSRGSPNGLQGLLQYFNLVEGCLAMIKDYQSKKRFKYDWIVRTRVDGYWSSPLSPGNFIAGKYLVPPGSQFGGLNDRLGIGDLKTSQVALSRISLIPRLDAARFRQLNSESAFKAQLVTEGVEFWQNRLPFCILSDRKYDFPPVKFGVPVASLLSDGPMSGAKCRPCTPVCRGPCVADVVGSLDRSWSWTDWSNGSLELCDAHDAWEKGWEKIFDRVTGKKFALVRKRIGSLSLKECEADFESIRNRTAIWESPTSSEICSLGLGPK